MTIFGSFHFSDTLLRTYSKAIAIMVVRFRPTAAVFHTAASIAEVIQKLEQGNRSSLFADADSIKLGLMNPTIRRAIMKRYPNRFTFQRCKRKESVSPPSAKKSSTNTVSPVTLAQASIAKVLLTPKSASTKGRK